MALVLPSICSNLSSRQLTAFFWFFCLHQALWGLSSPSLPFSWWVPKISTFFLVVSNNFFVVSLLLETSSFVTCFVCGIPKIHLAKYISITSNLLMICDDIFPHIDPRYCFLSTASDLLLILSFSVSVPFSVTHSISLSILAMSLQYMDNHGSPQLNSGSC